MANEKEDIELGDVVWLKSGGPAMTANGYLHSGAISCTWFKDGEASSVAIHPEGLTKTEPTKPVPSA